MENCFNCSNLILRIDELEAEIRDLKRREREHLQIIARLQNSNKILEDVEPEHESEV